MMLVRSPPRSSTSDLSSVTPRCVPCAPVAVVCAQGVAMLDFVMAKSRSETSRPIVSAVEGRGADLCAPVCRRRLWRACGDLVCLLSCVGRRWSFVLC